MSAGGFTSNSVTADFRAISGSALDQGTNQTSRDFAFTYRVTIENIPSGQFPYAIAGNVSAPLDAVTNEPRLRFRRWSRRNANNKFVQDNLHEIRLQFRWPILPNRPRRQRRTEVIYRTTTSGQLVVSQVTPPRREPAPTLLFPQSAVFHPVICASTVIQDL